MKHGLRPEDDLGPHMATLEARIKKGINAVIGILKSQEKDQKGMATALLQALMEAGEKDKQPKFVEKKKFTKDNLIPFRD